MKKYKIKKSKALTKQLKPYWQEMGTLEFKFRKKLSKLEDKMEKETGIKGVEFFYCDNSIVGIGTADKTMELIHFD